MSYTSRITNIKEKKLSSVLDVESNVPVFHSLYALKIAYLVIVGGV